MTSAWSLAVVCWQLQTVSGLICLLADSCQVPGMRFLHALQAGPV